MNTPLREETIPTVRWAQSRWRVLLAAAVCMIFIGLELGCSQPPPPPVGTSNAQLDLSIGNLGDDWIVETNQGSILTFRRSDPERPGTIDMIVGPEEDGVNLVEAMDTHRQTIENLPDGSYFGGQELTGPMGTAFYSRGRYSLEGATVEETRILSIHPRSSRLFEIVYRYPAGEDSSTRVGELVEVFAEVE